MRTRTTARFLAPRVVLSTLVAAGCGTDVAGPSTSLFSCVLAEPKVIATGEVVQVSGAGNQGLCLAADAASAEFVYIPFFATDPPAEDERVALAVELVGGGVREVTGPPSPGIGGLSVGESRVWLGASAPAASAPRPDHEFHAWLRQREVDELGPLLRRPDGTAWVMPSVAAPGAVAPANVPTVGELVEYNVAVSCTVEDLRTGRVEHVSEHAIVVADVENPAGLVATDFRHFALTFDTLIHPLVIEHFGEPTDIDGNGRVIIFFTRAVNERTPPGSTTFTAGFFWSGDLFPATATPRAQACPAANQAEIFYMLTADPTGEAGVEFTVDFVRRIAIGVIAHEYQHLVNAARRLWVNEAVRFETIWLNEGLSHIAEELVFFRAAGLEPGRNLTADDIRGAANGVDAFNTHMANNFNNLQRYLERPDTASLMGRDGLATRGAAWSFLRYAADRAGRGDAPFFTDLVNSRVAGLENLGDVVGAPLAWMQDWTVSVYADEAVPGLDPRFRQGSWNMRDVFEESTVQRYPLRVLVLQTARAETLSLQPGATAFPRFGIGPDGRAVIHVETGRSPPPATLRGSFVRTR